MARQSRRGSNRAVLGFCITCVKRNEKKNYTQDLPFSRQTNFMYDSCVSCWNVELFAPLWTLSIQVDLGRVFFFLSQTTFLCFINSLWLKYKKRTVIINHFVVIVYQKTQKDFFRVVDNRREKLAVRS